MISWKSRVLSVLLVIVICTIPFSSIFTPIKKAQALAACASSAAAATAGASAGATDSASLAAIGIPSYIGSTIAPNLGIIAGTNGAINTKQNCLDGIGWMIANLLIAYMTESIVNWINSGFEGSPTFVSDPQGFLLGIADEQFVNVLNQMFPETEGLTNFLCSPFRFDIKFNLLLKFNLNYKRNTIPRGCSLTDIGNNISGSLEEADRNIKSQYNDYTNGNFSNGGWGSWFKVSQDPANNKYGAELQSDMAVDAAIRDAQGRELRVLDWGNGFNSITKKFSDGINKIITPGKQVQESLNKALGAGQDKLNVADSIDEIVGALMSQLMQKALQGGVSSLSESSGGNPSYLDQLDAENNSTVVGSSTLTGTVINQQGGVATTSAATSTDITIGTTSSSYYTNIALGKKTRQSSTDNDRTSYYAVDGSTAGYDNTATDKGRNEYWEVALEKTEKISSVEIWIDPNGYQLNQFWVMVSDSNAPLPGDLNGALNQSVWKQYYAGNISRPFAIDLSSLNVSGKYVRIQQKDTGKRRLQLSEVKVFATTTPTYTY